MSGYTKGPWNFHKEDCAIKYAVNAYATKETDIGENLANANLIECRT